MHTIGTYCCCIVTGMPPSVTPTCYSIPCMIHPRTSQRDCHHLGGLSGSITLLVANPLSCLHVKELCQMPNGLCRCTAPLLQTNRRLDGSLATCMWSGMDLTKSKHSVRIRLRAGTRDLYLTPNALTGRMQCSRQSWLSVKALKYERCQHTTRLHSQSAARLGKGCVTSGPSWGLEKRAQQLAEVTVQYLLQLADAGSHRISCLPVANRLNEPLYQCEAAPKLYQYRFSMPAQVNRHHVS